MRHNVDLALSALLTVICPGVSTHPTPFAFRTPVLPKASSFAFVRSLELINKYLIRTKKTLEVTPVDRLKAKLSFWQSARGLPLDGIISF